jgi:TPR repeat protein
MNTKKLRERAGQGDADAQYTIAAHYATGFRTKKNRREAVKWYQRAALQKHVDAAWNFGWMLVRGEGVRPNVKNGMRWIRRAAKNGSVDAMKFLAAAKRAGLFGFPKARRVSSKSGRKTQIRSN